MKKHSRLLFLLPVLPLLLLLLVLVESPNPDASIRSIWDALWYAMVTLTTVGYGDTFPVTPVGRAIGLVFLLMSITALAALIQATSGFLRKEWPCLRLRLHRRERLCVFSQVTPEALALARDLQNSQPGMLPVFCRSDTSLPRALCVPLTPPEVSQRLRPAPVPFFLMSSDRQTNEQDAAELGTSHPLYVRGSENPALPHARFFDDRRCCARGYWQDHPLENSEKTVLLIGDGELATALLEEALLSGCRSPFHPTVFHLCGNWQTWRMLHPALPGILGAETPVFHDMPDPGLCLEADRILFCGDDPEENSRLHVLYETCLPLEANIHLYALSPSLRETFGAPESVFTRRLVLHEDLDARARSIHESYIRRHGGTAWADLSPFLKASNRAAADHILTKVRLLLPQDPPRILTPDVCREAFRKWQALSDRDRYRRCEHERWMRFYALYNWRYGTEKNSRLRTHPSFLPYGELSEEEKAKDDLAWAQIGQLFPADRT